MLQGVSTTSTVGVKAMGVWPSTGGLGGARPQPERKSPSWKAGSSRSFRVCSLWSTPSFNVLLGAGWFGSRRLPLGFWGVTTTGAPRCSLLVLGCPPLFLQPLFPLHGSLTKLISPFFN